ncbi:MAG: hypothetical protein QOK23_3469 [Gammaproteobacteria bacterium]|jgi:hypothetical protein|nr:hypothetical protein [Gammaproteobacteria bacterium]MEA3141300.1 hypothetical protein [Gammaproteobacteria bacterium]
MYDLRRNDFDVANSVQVSSTVAVATAVRELFTSVWPADAFDKVAIAFEDFDKLFTGRMPGYHGVDTLYHDRQHSLDMTLAMARLLVGYERHVESRMRFGVDRVVMALVTSLFHDAGYIREFNDREHSNGAEFTLYHVTRSARFLARYLPTIGLENWVPVATRIVHFTGYEIKLNMIQLADPKDRKLGHLLGTADLIAQMADRCYLEKCRDRLYPEFVLGGVAATTNVDGSLRVRYSSGLDLLRQTPKFVRETFVARLEGEFEHAYRHLECLFGGRNPYLEAIERNVGYLHRVLHTERWPMLRRNPPLFTTADNPIGHVRGLMLDRLKELWA